MAALPDLALFANSGIPFTRHANLARTAIVLPIAPAEHEVALMLTALGRLAALTGDMPHALEVVDDPVATSRPDRILVASNAGATGIARTLAPTPLALTDGGLSLDFGDPRAFYRALAAFTLPRALERRLDALVGGGGGTLALDGARGLIAEARTPGTEDGTTLLLYASSAEAGDNLARALIDRRRVGELQGAAAIVDDDGTTALRTGMQYIAGDLSPLATAAWWLGRNVPIALALGALAAMLFGIAVSATARSRRPPPARRLIDSARRPMPRKHRLRRPPAHRSSRSSFGIHLMTHFKSRPTITSTFVAAALLGTVLALPVGPAVAQDAVPGAIDPADSPVIARLVEQGLYWQSRGEWDKARTAWEKILLSDPVHPEALRGQFFDALQTGDRRAATALVGTMRERRPGHPFIAQMARALDEATGGRSALDRARELVREGEVVEALAQYRIAFGDIAPNGELALEYYTTLGGAPGEWQAAADGLARLVESAPDDARYALAYAKHLTYDGRWRRGRHRPPDGARGRACSRRRRARGTAQGADPGSIARTRTSRSTRPTSPSAPTTRRSSR